MKNEINFVVQTIKDKESLNPWIFENDDGRIRVIVDVHIATLNCNALEESLKKIIDSCREVHGYSISYSFHSDALTMEQLKSQEKNEFDIDIHLVPTKETRYRIQIGCPQLLLDSESLLVIVDQWLIGYELLCNEKQFLSPKTNIIHTKLHELNNENNLYNYWN